MGLIQRGECAMPDGSNEKWVWAVFGLIALMIQPVCDCLEDQVAQLSINKHWLLSSGVRSTVDVEMQGRGECGGSRLACTLRGESFC